jgi:hypothetical protein
MTTLTTWERVNQRRKIWEPSNPAKNSETSVAPLTISRCLSLIELEPAVAYFINSGLDKSDNNVLGEEGINCLKRNVQDEDRHEKALKACKAAMSNYDSSFEEEGHEIAKAWLEISDRVNPITIAAVAESSLFMIILPIYTLFGGNSLKITSGSISDDEGVHITSHRYASELLRAKPTKELDNLRESTVAWLTQDIGKETNGAWTQERCLKNSKTLLRQGRSDMTETQFSTVLAPFELRNDNFSEY